jgi:hypothetical protein
MCDLSNISLIALIKYLVNDLSSIHFAMNLGIIKAHVLCNNYHKMNLNKRQKKVDGYSWRCSCTEKSIKVDSFFYKNGYHHLPLSKIIYILYFWIHETRVTKVAIFLEITKKTAIDYYNLFRELCSKDLNETWIICGGNDRIVEIDETFLGKKQKYCKGKYQKKVQNIFGIWDRKTSNCVLYFIQDKIQGNGSLADRIYKLFICFFIIMFFV